MEAKELRIGNYVSHINHSKWYPQVGIALLTEILNDSHEFHPIPLTEEWLLEFGFNKEYTHGYIGIDVHNSDFVLTYPTIMGEFQQDFAFEFNSGRLSKFKEIKYVHELQNFYFALTGEELQYNPTSPKK